MSLWWAAKIALGLALAFQPLVSLGLNLPGPLVRPAMTLGTFVAVLGCLVHLGHYVLLRQRESDLDAPRQLHRTGGIWPWVRHPMYLGDAVSMMGFVLLWPTALALALTLAGWACVAFQAMTEDRELARAFPAEHAAWTLRSWMLIPFVW